ncbi:hypothetical protein VTO73DRAFT_4834 [Trametes versicolor]
MPTVASGKVLVTGANGFIAGWVIKTLLEHGYAVRGTVRSAGKGDAIKEFFASYGDKFELVVVENMISDGVFDQAVNGVDAIVHAASPIGIDAEDPDAFIIPAVNGTTSILKSASLAGSTVKRIVIISSLAAVLNMSRGTPCVLTESDWNDPEVKEVKEKGCAAPQAAKYRASKTMAERAAWDLYREGKERGVIGWDLVTLCPPWVFGPVLGAKSPHDFNFSMKTWYELAVKEEGEVPTWSKGSWVDVRDFAEAHLLVLTKPEAGGERYIIAAGPYLWSQWVAVARQLLGKSSEEEVGDNAAKVVFEVVFDATKSREQLGLTYRSKEETAAFLLDEFKAKGWC